MFLFTFIWCFLFCFTTKIGINKGAEVMTNSTNVKIYKSVYFWPQILCVDWCLQTCRSRIQWVILWGASSSCVFESLSRTTMRSAVLPSTWWETCLSLVQENKSSKTRSTMFWSVCCSTWWTPTPMWLR